jgi:PAS domain S-box-containing protein
MKEYDQRNGSPLDDVQDVIFSYRPVEKRFSYLSPAVLAFTGYSPEEICASAESSQLIIHPDDVNASGVSQFQHESPDTEIVVRWMHRDGRVIWTEQRISVHKSSDGRPVEIHGIARNITVRHLAEIEGEKLAAEKDEIIRKLSQSFEKTIEGWALSLELRDRDSQGHSMRVADLTVRTAAALGVSGEALDQIRRGALLHDIGKLGIPDSILQKPGPLTENEWFVMRIHPAYAYQILDPIEFLRPSIDIPYYHRERWDGSGYPHGLQGEKIPLPARIFAVVDVWEALNSDRPYRPAWEPKKVAQFLQEQAGVKFDPHVVDVFLTEVVVNEL